MFFLLYYKFFFNENMTKTKILIIYKIQHFIIRILYYSVYKNIIKPDTIFFN